MILNKMLSETDFKANPENFGLPLFFLVTNKEDMLKMLNSVCNCEEDLMFFHDYIKQDLKELDFDNMDDEDFDGVRYKVTLGEMYMEDAVYSRYSEDEIVFEGKYKAFYIENAEFNLDFKESLIFFINFDSGFDRYGDVIVRSVCHCKTIDLLRYRISLPEPTYFLNS